MRSAVTGVLLAAGPSTRFDGRVPKQLVRIDGEPLVRRVARAALGSRLDRVLVVVGHEGATVAAVLAGLAVEVVENPLWPEGQSTSVKAGLSRLSPRCEGAMFVPVDQPYLSSEVIDRLIGRFEATGGPVVAPTHSGRRRAPVLVARALFDRMARITGDEGGRQIFSKLPKGQIQEVEVPELALADLDTTEDLRRLRAMRLRAMGTGSSGGDSA